MILVTETSQIIPINNKIIFEKENLSQGEQGHLFSVMDVSFLPSGELVTASWDGTARIWNLENLEDINQTEVLFFFPEAIERISTSPDGRFIASTLGEANAVHIFDQQEQTPPFQILRDSVIKGALDWSPNSQRLIVATFENTIDIWDFSTSETMARLPLSHDLGGRSLAWSPDGERIIVGLSNGYIQVLNLDGVVIQEFEGHDAQITFLAIDSTGRLVTASEDSKIRLWNLEDQSILGEHFSEGLVSYVRIIESSVIWGEERKTTIWDLQSGAISEVEHEFSGSGIAVNSEGNLFARGEGEREVIIWSITEKRLLKTINGRTMTCNRSCLLQESNGVTKIAYGSADRSVVILNLDDGGSKKSLEGHHENVSSISSVLSDSEGSLLVSGLVG